MKGGKGERAKSRRSEGERVMQGVMLRKRGGKGEMQTEETREIE